MPRGYLPASFGFDDAILSRFFLPWDLPVSSGYSGATLAPGQLSLRCSAELAGRRRVISSVGSRFPSAAGERKHTNPFKEEISIMANQKPASEVRIGSIKATIWRNQTETGARHNVTFERLYKDGDKWKSTQSFGRDDLLLLAKVADEAHSRIFQLQQEETQSD
jgi:hypothetical protein